LNGGVDAAARIKAPFAARSKLPEALPPLASELLAGGLAEAEAEGDGPLSLVFQSISPGNYLEFAADGFFDRNDRMHLEYESRKHRTEFVNGHRSSHSISICPPHSPTRITKNSILKLAGAFH